MCALYGSLTLKEKNLKTSVNRAVSRNRLQLRLAAWLRPITLVAVLGIAGCAGTKTSGFQISPPALSAVQPNTVLVEVTQTLVVSALDPAEQRRVREVASALQGGLIEKLKIPGTKIVALPLNGVTPTNIPGTFLLHCSLVEADGGNQALRLAVGFGAGRALLRIHAELLDLGDHSSSKLASWDTSSTTGAFPGPGLGFLGAVQAGSALGMVGGSVGALLGMKQTQSREVDQSSTEIVARLHSVFQERNWGPLPTKG
jgi:hypothetical protein